MKKVFFLVIYLIIFLSRIVAKIVNIKSIQNIKPSFTAEDTRLGLPKINMNSATAVICMLIF